MADSLISEPSSPPFTNLARKRHRSYTPKVHNDNINVESARTGTSSARESSTLFVNPSLHQSLTSIESNYYDTASRTITAWRKVHEITVLKAILEYYDVIGEYPFDNESHMQKFYKDWIAWRGVYVDQDVFINKLIELLQRFSQNKKIIDFGENVLMDYYDAEIHRLSHLIWAEEDDSEDSN
ncbi:hypothetical protein CTI12_AA269560 [Artemisia annua]|uniref:Uncharacterized protein n=1 Tax=Artemisia annua TaxID=35608 RepID=A0A2U1NGB5_ARTAN|nr:hypothetical protein CTI12_AA269560 [Artemisia annua]